MNNDPLFVFKEDDNELLWRFTSYIEKVVHNARVDYLRKQKYRKREVLVEHIPENAAVHVDKPFMTSDDAFNFDEEELAKAFGKLNVLRQRILTLLFVNDLKPQEIAEILGCSTQFVYDQKRDALKRLRKLLEIGGDESGN